MAIEAVFKQGIWFGQSLPESRRNDLKLVAADIDASNEDRAIASVELLKLGDFSAKAHLLEAMSSAEPSLRTGCCAVFCSVADHGNIADLMRVLDHEDEAAVRAFALYSVATLSFEAIPYLLSLAEIWEDTKLEQQLCDAARTLFPLNRNDPVTLAEMHSHYESLAREIDRTQYYLWGKPVFAGDLTKQLMTGAAEAKLEMRELQMFDVPMFLSVWSGLLCPVRYSSQIDEAAIGNILTYVKQISLMRWEKGRKSFYGHSVGQEAVVDLSTTS